MFPSSRRDFLKSGFALSSVVAVASLLPGTIGKLLAAEEKPPRQDLDLVFEFVRVAHFDLNRTKELLRESPALIQASHDWGGGDWETAIEAASHTGQKEIASFLIENGARMTIFTAVMLGKMEIVKPTLDAFPGMVYTKGPHGLSMLHHAEKGGDDTTIDYIASLINK